MVSEVAIAARTNGRWLTLDRRRIEVDRRLETNSLFALMRKAVNKRNQLNARQYGLKRRIRLNGVAEALNELWNRAHEPWKIDQRC